jgi:DNA-binding transcriptional MerR regulator
MARAAADEKLYKIGEVCRVADVQPYVLRYWETEFPQLAPNKSGGGQRMYTRREIDTILRIKELLYRDGFTIAGAKKKLEEPVAAEPEVAVAPPPSLETQDVLTTVKDELRAILKMLG